MWNLSSITFIYIFLEVVTDLKTESFIASLKRFVVWHGKPEEFFSDRGTYFEGAESEVKKMMSEIFSGERIHKYFTDEMVIWKFTPLSAIHLGGEAVINKANYESHAFQSMIHYMFYFLFFILFVCLFVHRNHWIS